MKKIFITISLLLIAGCSTTSPPAPKQPSGKWHPVNTTINEIKANTL